MKYKLKDSKDNKNAKGVVNYRVIGDDEPKGFRKVVLGNATQKQLADLHSIGHPFVEEVKAATVVK